MKDNSKVRRNRTNEDSIHAKEITLMFGSTVIGLLMIAVVIVALILG